MLGMQSGTPRDARIFGKMDIINISTVTYSCSIKPVDTPYGNTIYSTGFHCARFQHHASGREEYTPATHTFPTESCAIKRLEYSRGENVRTYAVKIRSLYSQTALWKKMFPPKVNCWSQSALLNDRNIGCPRICCIWVRSLLCDSLSSIGSMICELDI